MEKKQTETSNEPKKKNTNVKKEKINNSQKTNSKKNIEIKEKKQTVKKSLPKSETKNSNDNKIKKTQSVNKDVLKVNTEDDLVKMKEKQNYKSVRIENIKKIKSELFNLKEMIGIVIITALVGFFMGFMINKGSESTGLSHYEKELISNYRYILNNYYKDIEPRDLISNSIKGMLGYLDDPYADYIDIDQIDNFNILVNGEYEGIGIQISYTENFEPIVTYVFQNSPASKEGIKYGDIIISINDIDVTKKTLDEIKGIISDLKDEQFNITYKREDMEYKASLKRNKIIIESVSSKLYEQDNKKIGYIRLENFATNSYEQFKTELNKIESKDINSLIIDLRDNTGGQLIAVDKIVSLFTKDDVVIYQMKEKDKITKFYDDDNEERIYDIVVLVNEYSASASELMAGALKEAYGATIIGNKTYGKGTAQEIVTLDSGEQYKFTTKEWLTAKGNSIDGIGIIPNIKIEQPDEFYKNPMDENDEQLKKSIEFLCK